MPLSLSAEEMDAVLAAAAPIVAGERDAFLRELAAELERHPTIGEGLVHRLAAQLQRDFVVSAQNEAVTRAEEARHGSGPRSHQAGRGGR